MFNPLGLARLLATAGAALLAFVPASFAQRPEPPARTESTAADAEDRRERLTMERFLTLLEKNPRRGTALDRVYGYHVERGTLDAFIKTYEDRVAKTPADGDGWLLLGLSESQRGRDAAAVNALRRAEETRPDDPLASYYLGQALVLIGQPDDAASAFERALARKPKRNDLLEIFQALGRVYQRAQKTKEAMAVWSRLETLFPDDPRVLEQIASALAEEGQPDQALPRYEALSKTIKDPFRQAQLAMTAADLEVRLGKTDKALRDFESLLGKLRPDSWLYREVRRKIDEVFLRNDDQAGLASYYERWVKANPEDVEALVRLGRSLAAQGRAAEAHVWYEKAIKLAPTRRELRLALIGQLVQDQKFADAAAQYEAMDKTEPNNPDTLRDWGGLLLRDMSKTEAARKSAATAVWRRLLDARPNDAVTAAQVADLFRQAEMPDDGLALYRKAIELAPGDPQYREYIGEFLHALKRPDDALAQWMAIAEGKNRNTKNLVRLAEVLSGFGYLKQAIPPLTEAVKAEGDDFTLRLKLAELLHRAERYDEARTQLDTAERLAEKDEERSAGLEAQVKNDLAAGKVAERIADLRKELEGDGAKGNAGARWTRLARYLEADGKLPESESAVSRAIAVEPRSVPAWTLAARVRESSGQLGDAAEAFRRLAEIDRRNRTEYLTGVAKLEARLGRVDEALKAGRDLIAAAPGNPESYEFFASLCSQLGRNDEGLDALRRAVRINPNEVKVVLTLAETLAGLFRTEEAVEMYWRAFEKSPDLDGKLGVVTRLTELYLQRNQFDRLLGRLQREQGESTSQQQQRELAICLAQAYATSGDLGSARSELERMLAANTRDTQLLQQLSKLAEEEGDLESAAKYQKQLVDLAPSDEGSLRLAQLYVRFGDIDEAQALWSRMASGQKETYRVLQAIDSLLGNDKAKAVVEITETMVRKDPRDWEAVYREGVAYARLGKPDEAVQRFRTLLDLRLDDDDRSAIVKARRRDPRLQSSGARASRTGQFQTTPLEDRINNVLQIRMTTGLENNRSMASTRNAPASWPPPDFGQARMAAIGWTLSLSQKQGKDAQDKALDSLKAAAGGDEKGKAPRDPRPLWDWYYACALRNEYRATYEAARSLGRATPTDPAALWVYLTSLGSRQMSSGTRYYVAPGSETKDGTPPLPPEEIDQVLASYRALRQRRPDLAQGQTIQNVSVELKRAKRTEDADRLYKEVVEGADQIAAVVSAFSLAGQRGDVDALIQLSDRFDRLQAGQAPGGAVYGGYYFGGTGNAIAQGMSVRAAAKSYGDVHRLLDHYLASARRRLEKQPRRAGQRFGNQYPPGYTPYYQVWSGKTAKNVRLAFPLPNEYYDTGAITVLRTAYELYKQGDLTSDLTAHLRAQADSAPTPADALYPRLALSYLAWWDDDKDAGIAEFAKVADAAKAESDLRLTLAELREQRGDPADALAIVDAVKPLDNATMQRREEQALRLAVLTGNLERARHAAERLFGLRLDTDTQVRLAGQMNQLGMHDLAESVLARARRRAGGKAAALVGLMLQYQRQDKNDVAVQVALQILRSTSGVRVTNPNVYNPDDPDAARDAAIQVLARSGRIKSMIERVNEQLSRTPNAVQLHQALSDYYKADGQRDQARAELKKITELRPDDAALRLQIATQLVRDGQAVDAIPHYKAAVKKEPSLLARSFNAVENAFRQANKMDEMVALVESIDIRSLGQPYYVTNLIQNLSNDPRMQDKVMPLFRKAWEAFPEQRMDLISYIRQDAFWQMPESYEYARQAILNTAGTYNPNGQWNAFQSITMYNGDGRITSTMSRILDLAASLGKLEGLAAELEAAVEKSPDWSAGKATLAMVRCRTGQFDDAKRLVRLVLDRFKDEPVSPNALWVIGSELENYGATSDLATTVYEGTLAKRTDDPYTSLNFNYSPVRRLISIYERDGRKEDARRVLVESARPREFDGGYPDGYIEQMRLQGLTSAAQQLVSLGYAAEAVPLYIESMALAETIGPNTSYYIGNLDQIRQRARDGLELALQGLDGSELARTVQRLLEAEPVAGPAAGGPNNGGPPADKGPARDQAVNLIVLVHPRELDKSAVKSLFAEAVTACARSPEGLGPVEEKLRELRQRYPEDFSVQVASALAALAKTDRDQARAALDRLATLAENTPLEPLGPGARANARQRAEAGRQVPLWIVARACWADESTRQLGDRFAARALEASLRQVDNRWTMAMLREQGQHALDQKDEPGADAAWSRMLDLILARDSASGPSARPAAAAPPPATSPGPAMKKAKVRPTSYEAPPPAAAPVPSAKPSARPVNVPILTIDRFEQAMQVAKLAAAHKRFALSTRAVRDALAGGPPVPVPAKQDGQRVVSSRNRDNEPVDAITPRVIVQLVDLEGAWRRHRAPDEQVYEALRDVAMPAGRPSELFLYAQPIGPVTLRRPRSLGAMLATWAVSSGKVDDLRGRVEGRRAQPMAELPAAVLSVQIEQAGGNYPAAAAALEVVTSRLKKSTLRASAELACHAAVPALRQPETVPAALAVLDVCVKAYQGSDVPEPAASLLALMAARQLELGDIDGGRKRLNDYLDSADRSTVRYGGDYPVYLRKQTLLKVAAEFAHAGFWTDTLDVLGRFVDAPAYSGGDPPVGHVLVLTVRQLASQPAKPRYETLKAWTLPTSTRRIVRILAALETGDEPPAAFTQTFKKEAGTAAGPRAATGW